MSELNRGIPLKLWLTSSLLPKWRSSRTGPTGPWVSWSSSPVTTDQSIPEEDTSPFPVFTSPVSSEICRDKQGNLVIWRKIVWLFGGISFGYLAIACLAFVPD